MASRSPDVDDGDVSYLVRAWCEPGSGRGVTRGYTYRVGVVWFIGGS